MKRVLVFPNVQTTRVENRLKNWIRGILQADYAVNTDTISLTAKVFSEKKYDIRYICYGKLRNERSNRVANIHNNHGTQKFYLQITTFASWKFKYVIIWYKGYNQFFCLSLYCLPSCFRFFLSDHLKQHLQSNWFQHQAATCRMPGNYHGT